MLLWLVYIDASEFQLWPTKTELFTGQQQNYQFERTNELIKTGEKKNIEKERHLHRERRSRKRKVDIWDRSKGEKKKEKKKRNERSIFLKNRHGIYNIYLLRDRITRKQNKTNGIPIPLGKTNITPFLYYCLFLETFFS